VLTVREAWAVTIGAVFLTVMAVVLVAVRQYLPGLVFAAGSLGVIGMGAVAAVRGARRRRRGWTPEDDGILDGQRRLR
jgi:ABC-type uncharacterized transport system YnjBCD permease subunit